MDTFRNGALPVFWASQEPGQVDTQNDRSREWRQGLSGEGRVTKELGSTAQKRAQSHPGAGQCGQAEGA